jgi:putative FmdB family regulatory protein
MPFYEYECPACRYYLEVLQKISDKPLKKCPSCGKSGFKRLMSAPVFRLKGSGWYETDFKSDKEGKRNLAGAERDESKTVAPEATKTDSSKAEAAKTETAKTAGGDQGGAGTESKAPAADKARGGSRRAPAPAAKARKASGSGKSASRGAARRPSRTSARKGRR